MAEFNGSNEAYFCPITCQLMVDPVIDSDGNSYERAAIEEWLSRTGMSPITRNAMSVADLVANRALKDAIDVERATLPSTAGSNRVPMDVSVVRKWEPQSSPFITMQLALSSTNFYRFPVNNFATILYYHLKNEDRGCFEI